MASKISLWKIPYRFFFPCFKGRSPTQPTPLLWPQEMLSVKCFGGWRFVGKSLSWLPCSNVVPFFVGWGGGRCFFLWNYSNQRMSTVRWATFYGGCKMLRVRIFESRIHPSSSWGLWKKHLPPITSNPPTHQLRPWDEEFVTKSLDPNVSPSVVGRLFGGWGAENQNVGVLKTSNLAIPAEHFFWKKLIFEKPTCWCTTSGSSGWQDALVILHGRFCGRYHIQT